MGEGAIKIAKENPDAVVVVLAGSGHVVYNLGIGRIINIDDEYITCELIKDIKGGWKPSRFMFNPNSKTSKVKIINEDYPEYFI